MPWAQSFGLFSTYPSLLESSLGSYALTLSVDLQPSLSQEPHHSAVNMQTPGFRKQGFTFLTTSSTWLMSGLRKYCVNKGRQSGNLKIPLRTKSKKNETIGNI